MTFYVIKGTPRDNTKTKIYAYADAVVMVFASIQELQESINDSVQSAEEQSANKLRKNWSDGLQERWESEASRQSQLWPGTVKGHEYYKHVGITLQTSGKSLTTHNKEKLISIIWSMVDIQSLSK